MFKLEKRPQPSKAFAYLTPILAIIATMIAGGLLFMALGKTLLRPSEPSSGTHSLVSLHFIIAPSFSSKVAP